MFKRRRKYRITCEFDAWRFSSEFPTAFSRLAYAHPGRDEVIVRIRDQSGDVEVVPLRVRVTADARFVSDVHALAGELRRD